MAKPTTTGKDYGHKLYMNTTAYPQAIARPGDAQYDQRVKRPHSDDKKPYYPDEYQEMEHYWTPYDPPNMIPPGIPDDPRIPPNDPNMPPGGGDDREPGESEFTGCIWTIPRGPIVLKPGQTSYHGIGLNVKSYDPPILTDPLVRLYVNYGPIRLLSTAESINQQELDKFPNNIVGVQALENIDPDDYLQDEGGEFFPAEVVGVTMSGEVCAWNLMVVICPPPVEISWDTENNPTQINAGDNALIYVLDGAPPFKWEVSGGEGFTLASSKTSSRVNVLYASDSACGTVTITVTDGCDTPVTGKILADNGGWVLAPELNFCTCVNTNWCSPSNCVVAGIKYNVGVNGHPACYVGGTWVMCSWGGGCHPAVGTCTNMCSDTDTNPCSPYSPADVCEVCLEENHWTIYRGEAVVSIWGCP